MTSFARIAKREALKRKYKKFVSENAKYKDLPFARFKLLDRAGIIDDNIKQGKAISELNLTNQVHDDGDIIDMIQSPIEEDTESSRDEPTIMFSESSELPNL